MRLRAILFAFAALIAVTGGAWGLAVVATDWVERETREQLDAALAAAGQDWVAAEVDGLVVALTGEAPDETGRFRALEIARQVVSGARVEDRITVATANPLAPPDFALEILRNEDEISLIGLVPEAAGRDAITAGLAAGGLPVQVTDMLETAAHHPPPGWVESLRFGLETVAALPRAKVSVVPGRVTVAAVMESADARDAEAARLQAAAPETVALVLELAAPRPVIAPFRAAFTLEDGAAVLGACSAETEEDAGRILAAAREAGAAGAQDCAVGLGAPMPDWVEAVTEGIAAVRAMGGGGFEIIDIDAALTAPAGFAPEALEAVAARLREAMPVMVSLATHVPPQVRTEADGTEVYAPEFRAALSADGALRLTGPVFDTTSRIAIQGFAEALFGHENVDNAMVLDANLPEGWPGRVLAGVEALSLLKEGELRVTPEAVAVSGSSTLETAPDDVEALLRAKVEGAASVEVRYDAVAAAIEARPRPEACAAEIEAILAGETILFPPSSAAIADESRDVIEAIAGVLRSCPGTRFEIGGHTDSQGREEMNRQLSERRAAAVLRALMEQDLPLVELTARGYGPDAPVADNRTDEGRARNRRIEFTLLGDLLSEPEEEPVAVAVAAAADTATDLATDAGAASGADGAAAGVVAETCAAEIGAILAEETILFAPSSAEIDAESVDVVAAIGAVLARCPGVAFEIGGHTDDRGGDEMNRALSQRRAEAVLAALEAMEIEGVALTARGYGPDQPVADNDTQAGRAQNRRIAFTLIGAEAEGAGAEAAAAAPEVAAGAAAGAVPETCAAEISAILAEETILFAPSSAAIDAESADVVEAIGAVLARCPGVRFEIGGHTDNRGRESMNRELSERRAEAVLAALEAMELQGVALTARGYGPDRPVADNGTQAGRAQNRRIEFTLVGAAEAPDAGKDAGEDAGGPD
jgi:OOP family OmpA-OmpF porin